MDTQPSAFSDWLDQFFAAYHGRRPVNATFVGVYGYDHKLPDYSDEGAGDTLAEVETLLQSLQKLPPEPLTEAEALDRKLAEGFLEIQEWEYGSRHFHRGNPSLYTGEAILGILSLFMHRKAPLADRVAAARARMEAVPALLAQGEDNVREAPLAWTERAVRECKGSLIFLGEGVEHLIRDEGIEDPGFRDSADKAARAFADFQHYLETELRARPTDRYACGEDALTLLMQKGHFLDETLDEVERYAEVELAEAQANLERYAPDVGAETVEDALAQLAEFHPTLREYYERYGQVWQACRATAEEQDLLTWPEFPIEYAPRPKWSREAAPYLYLLFYRSPAAFNRPPVHTYWVTPIEPSMPAEEQQRLLRSNNDSVIKLNHVVHHGSIGHHVQNWHAYHAESRIGQIAAIDCATRIAMFCSGTMAEGWACYATDLMVEAGFLTPLEEYAQYHQRRRMTSRALADVQLHTGRLSLDETIALYQRRGGMSPDAAYSEAVRTSMFPGVTMMYLMGRDAIHQLRQDLAAQQGASFSLRQFHDRFLSYGSVPVSLIAASMLEGAYNAGDAKS
jgi:uncharacterized protein (DUF885 family)